MHSSWEIQNSYARLLCGKAFLCLPGLPFTGFKAACKEAAQFNYWVEASGAVRQPLQHHSRMDRWNTPGTAKMRQCNSMYLHTHLLDTAHSINRQTYSQFVHSTTCRHRFELSELQRWGPLACPASGVSHIQHKHLPWVATRAIGIIFRPWEHPTTTQVNGCIGPAHFVPPAPKL